MFCTLCAFRLEKKINSKLNKKNSKKYIQKKLQKKLISKPIIEYTKDRFSLYLFVLVKMNKKLKRNKKMLFTQQEKNTQNCLKNSTVLLAPKKILLLC